MHKSIGIGDKQKDDHQKDWEKEGGERYIAQKHKKDKEFVDNEKVAIKWMPFHCDQCDRTFDDLFIMRKHCKTHIKF